MSTNKLALLVNFIGVDKMSGALRNIIGLSRQGGTSIKALSGEQRKYENQLNATRKAIEKGTGNVEEAIARERELAQSLADVNTQLARQKRLAAVNADVRAMARRSEALRTRGQDNMLGGVAMAAPLVLAGKAAMDFSSGMVDIQQKAELTNAETDRMAASLMQLARAAHQLPEDMRAGVDRLSGFGMDPRQALAMIGPISRLGTAFKVDLADGSAAAFANFNNLKVPLDQTTTALNMMAAGSKVGSFEVADMARNFPALTARLQALGDVGTPAVADLTAALEVAMNTAGSADEAANNIANLLGKINSPTVINAFAKKFGVDLPAAMKKFQAQGMTTMEAFATAAQQATGGDMKKLGWVVEDQQAQMGLLALMQNMDKYRQMRGAIQNQSAGTIDAAFGQREARDAAVQWQDFTGQLQRMAIVVGTRLLPQFQPFLATVTTMMDRAGQWADANPRLASSLASLAGGIVVARVGLGALQFAFGSILGPVATLWGWFGRAQALGQTASVLARLSTGFSVARSHALTFWRVLAPIGQSIGSGAFLGFKALVGDLGRMGLGLANAGKAAIIAGARFTVAAAQGAAMAARWAVGQVVAFGGALLQAGRAAMAMGWNFLRAGLMMLANPMVLAIVAIGAAIGVLAYLVYTNWDRIKAAFGAGWEWVKSTLAAAPAWLSTIGGMMMQGLLAMIDPFGLRNKLLEVARNGVEAFKAFFGIKSPSRLMMEMGGHVANGFALGIDGQGRAPPVPRGAWRPGWPLPGRCRCRPRWPRRAWPTGRAIRPCPITIHVHAAPGMDTKALAREVRRELEAAQGVRQRSRYDAGAGDGHRAHSSQLLTLGMFVFGMDTLAYSDLQRRITWRHEASDRFGARPAVQFIGPGDDDVTIAGACIPEIAGRYSALDTLASMGDTGDAWALMNGLGEVWGYYVIVGLDLTHQTVMAGGVPRRIDFTVTLKRKD
jgi:phage protein U